MPRLSTVPGNRIHRQIKRVRAAPVSGAERPEPCNRAANIHSRSASAKAWRLRVRVLDVLLRLLRRAAGLRLRIGFRTAYLNAGTEALGGRKVAETAAREFVVDVKSRDALA